MHERTRRVSGLAILASLIIPMFLTGLAQSERVAADFSLTDIDGVEFSLSDFRTKVVLLDFFALSCSSCVAEMPRLKIVSHEFGDPLVVVSIDVEPNQDTVEDLMQFRQEKGIDWRIARDTAGVRGKYVDAIPKLVIIDQNGYIRYTHLGQTSATILSSEISYILSLSTGPADVNRDGKIDILDISIVARSFGSYFGNDTWNEAADLNSDGVVSIVDIAMAAKDFGKSGNTFNFLLDPSAEFDWDGDSSPEYWEASGSSDIGPSFVWRNEGFVDSHSVAVSIIYNESAPDSRSAQWYQNLNIRYSAFEIGSKYYFSFRYKSTIKCYVYAGFLNSSLAWIGGDKVECKPSTAWILSPLLEFTIPDGTYRMVLGISVWNGAAAQVTDALAVADAFELIGA